jgi:copper chaperone CopZ
MKTFSVDLPAMFGDHHVLDVRKILLDIDGVKDLYASSSFHIVEVEYDEKKTSEKDILAKLEEAGYMGELDIPQEKNDADVFADKELRHTASFEQLQEQIGFIREPSYAGRPLWPCPGMGPLPKKEDE